MRTFVAIEIPEPLVTALDRSLKPLRSRLANDFVRWVRSGSMHLTLRFLGEIEQQQVHAIESILDDVAQGFSKFVLEIGGFGCFPNTKRPRVLWVGFEPAGGNLLQLQAELADQIEQIGFERERRDYHPHLTIGRVRKGLSGAEIKVVSSWAENAELGAVGEFGVESISLMRSVLKPSGAVYTNLHTAMLMP